uniref:Uncharacterized protein n=1 Tax=Marseillevirus LCMAC101 TaxID=2506602 RepID=A0A481YSU4_9VIRU|nr:MAG: hypothetical protein LCMAC101_01430 [Marseillevirus LCMAC101]
MTMGQWYSSLWATETPVPNYCRAYCRAYYACHKHKKIYKSRFSHIEVPVPLYENLPIDLISLPCQKGNELCDITVCGGSRHRLESDGALYDIMWLGSRIPGLKHLVNLEEIDENGYLTQPGRNIKRSKILMKK